jgi:putative peptidoglycan lipid II flippase
MKNKFLLLASLRFMKIAFSAGAVILYARYFGIGFEMDSWVWASGITASVGMLLWGPVNETIRSRFVHLMSESGQAAAFSNARSVLLFTSVVSLLVSAVLYFGLPHIIGSLYPAGTPAQSKLLSEIILLMLPSIVIGQVLNLGVAYMNCQDIIYTPEMMGIFSSALNLLCVPLLAPRLGVYSLVVGYYLGILVSLIIVTHFLYVRKVMRGPLHLLVVWKDSKAAIFLQHHFFLHMAQAS